MRLTTWVYVLVFLVRSASCGSLWNPYWKDDIPSVRRLNEVDVNCTACLELEEDYGALELQQGGSKGKNDNKVNGEHHWTCLVDSSLTGGIENIDFRLPEEVEEELDKFQKELRRKKKATARDAPFFLQNTIGLEMSKVSITDGKIQTIPGKSDTQISERDTSMVDLDGETTSNKSKFPIKPGFKDLPKDESTAVTGSGPSSGRGNRRLAVKRAGRSRVLVLWVKAADAKCTPTPSQLTKSIFGGQGDRVNLKSQFRACSHGEMMFEPAVGKEIVGGVLKVQINQKVRGADRYAITNAITSSAQKIVGGLNKFDHVMYCIPPGTSGKWVGLGYYWWWRSIYNDKWILSPSCQMHEIGHNLNLRHSAKGGDPYGDISGYMGYSYPQSEIPLMCYNAAHSSFLGWYADKEVVFVPRVKSEWSGKLVGLADYSNPHVTSSHNIIVKIPMLNDADDKAFYISYNSKRGINSGTQMHGDKVTIVEGAEGLNTRMIASIPVGGAFTIKSFDGTKDSIFVKVESSGNDGSAKYVIVHLEAPCKTDKQCDDGDASNGREKCVSNVCTAARIVNKCKQSPVALTSKPSGLGPNVAPGSTVRASSFYMENPYFAPEHAIDGLEATEWASWNERNNAWLEIDLGRSKSVPYIGVLSRCCSDFVRKFVLTYSDGTCQVGELNQKEQGVMQYFRINVTTRKVHFQVEIGGSNSGAMEISLFAPMKSVKTTVAKPPGLGPNLALRASVQASSYFGTGYEASKAVDGSMKSEWASKGDGTKAWLKMDLKRLLKVTDIGYKSRIGPDFVNEFVVTFSDGTAQKCKMNASQTHKLQYCKVGGVVTRTIMFEVVAGGTNAGAIELAAFGPEPVAGGSLVKPSGLGPNVARGAAVTASSYFMNSPYFAPKNAVDGIFTSQWASRRDGVNTWLKMDFKKRYHLTHVGFLSRTGSDFVEIFVLKFSDGSRHKFRMNSFQQQKMQYFEINGKQGVGTKFARFEVEEGGINAGAYEISLFAKPNVVNADMKVPDTLGPNVALRSRVTASSFRGIHTPESAVNGRADDFWSSNGDGNKAWIKIDLENVHQVTTVAFKSTRGEAFVRRFSLTFSDGSVQIGQMNANRKKEIQYFDIDNVNTKLIEVHVLSGGANSGAYEIAAFSRMPVLPSALTIPEGLGFNKAIGGRVSVSSVYKGKNLFDASHVVDGIITTEWASEFDGNSAWMKIEFKKGPSYITHIMYKGRMGIDFVNRFSVTFSDGSKQICGMKNKFKEQMQYFDIVDVVTDSVLFEVEDGGINSGAFEFAAYALPSTIIGSAVRPPGLTEKQNVARGGSVTASSYYENRARFKPQNAIDGSFGTEWASDSDGVNAWLFLTFRRHYHLTHFAIMSRQKRDFSNQFTLVFSDGSTQICKMNPNESEKLQYFDLQDIVTNSIRMKVTSGPVNAGAIEVKAYQFAPR